ncbi:putative motility protein [Halomonas nitroreducens]|uniref:Putative motility protein n=1 Tax=Halomonas nitroreducens TaxID=447425 RepID=A0A431V2U3_9GAMM|nr:putative motility protein [Halomonas nitroreducens]RTR02440.1 putative motility protein [Halomonas nitroreducens]
MDTSVNNVVAQSQVMQQAQTAQQAQMQIFKAALDTQQQQVTALVESASVEPRLAQDGSLGTRIDTYA